MIRKLTLLFSSFLFIYLLCMGFPLLVETLQPRNFGKLFAEDFWHFRSGRFGAFSMLASSLVVASLAVLIACPFALGTAIYASEFVAGRRRVTIKVLVETLAAVPSVVYGLLGVIYLRGWVFEVTGPLGAASGDSLFTAALLLALMILPTFMTLSDDALRCVPTAYRQSARSLGLSHSFSVLTAVLPFAKKGIIGAAFLSLGRAFGETIAVFLVVGRADRPFDWSFFSLPTLISAGQTITSKLGGSEVSIAYGDPIHWGALLSLGLLLWLGVSLFSALHLLLTRGEK